MRDLRHEFEEVGDPPEGLDSQAHWRVERMTRHLPEDTISGVTRQRADRENHFLGTFSVRLFCLPRNPGVSELRRAFEW